MAGGIHRRCGLWERKLQVVICCSTGDEIQGLVLGEERERERGSLWVAYLVAWLAWPVVEKEVSAGVEVDHSFSTFIQQIFMDSYCVPEEVRFSLKLLKYNYQGFSFAQALSMDSFVC